MRCPFCNSEDSRVIDSRESKGGAEIRRRRECEKCNKRFTTYERVEEIPLMVIKKDETREVFDSNKVLKGILKATEKRAVSRSSIEKIVDDIELMIQQNPEKEIRTEAIGNYVMDSLKKLDSVAYVRFASVYRDFKDITDFKKEVERLQQESEVKKQAI
jgi:transcriptional repressor NrdR